jgi:putative YhbY family RNA-binding protein
MIELSPKARRELRAKAHRLHPVVIIGQHGLTPRVLHEIDVALRAHGLVKVRVFSEDRGEREAMLGRIASELDGAPVQHLGKILIVWRPVEEAPAAKPAKRPARKPVKAKPTKRTPREFVPVGRRLRGQPVAEPLETPPSRRRSESPAASRPPRGKSAPSPRRRRRLPE